MKNKKKKVVTSVKEINIYICLSLLVMVPLILNWKIINYDFTRLDDSSIIINNQSFLSNFSNVFKAFQYDNFISKDGKNYYRPVQTLTFMIDAQISGEKPQAYHFSNLLYHILTVIGLFILLRLLGIKNNLSFFLSLLFSVHPLFTDAIAWIAGRGDILVGLFGTLSFILFIKYNDTKYKLYFFLHSAAFAAALFSKEISVCLPIVILVYYWFVKNNKYKIRELFPFIASWCIIILSFLFLRSQYVHPDDLISLESFVRNLPVIPIFFVKLFIPLNLSPMPVYDITYTIMGTVFALSLIYYILKVKLVNSKSIMLGILWFLAFVVPAMFLRIHQADFSFEYLECRAYMPSIGIFIAVGMFFNEISKKDDKLLRFIIPLIIVYSVITFIYSGIFASPMVFYSSVIDSNPKNAYALCSRGNLYSAVGDFSRALVDYDNATTAVPYFSEPYYDIGSIYNSSGNYILAEKFLGDALKYDTLYPSINRLYDYAYVNLSSEKLTLKKYDEAIKLLNKAKIKYSGNFSIHNNLGLAYYSKSEYKSALSEYDQAIALIQTKYAYYNNRGMAKYRLKEFAGALEDFNSALSLNPEFLDARVNRGVTKVEVNDYQGAISDLTTSILSNPKNGIAWYFRGVAYSKLNKDSEAEADWVKAHDLGFQMSIWESK